MALGAPRGPLAAEAPRRPLAQGARGGPLAQGARRGLQRTGAGQGEPQGEDGGLRAAEAPAAWAGARALPCTASVLCKDDWLLAAELLIAPCPLLHLIFLTEEASIFSFTSPEIDSSLDLPCNDLSFTCKVGVITPLSASPPCLRLRPLRPNTLLPLPQPLPPPPGTFTAPCNPSPRRSKLSSDSLLSRCGGSALSHRPIPPAVPASCPSASDLTQTESMR